MLRKYLALVTLFVVLTFVLSQPTNCKNAAKGNLLSEESYLESEEETSILENSISAECRKKRACSYDCPDPFRGRQIFFATKGFIPEEDFHRGKMY